MRATRSRFARAQFVGVAPGLDGIGSHGYNPPMDEDSVAREIARAKLAALLPRVMEDGQLDGAEKKELIANLESGLLGREAVRAVFREFLENLHREVMSDGVLDDDERERLRTVVRELRIPQSFLSPEILAIVAAPTGG